MYRLEVKTRKGWKTGTVVQPSKEAAEDAMNKLIALGHPASKIRVTAETKIFG
jgi:hypothetical protein